MTEFSMSGRSDTRVWIGFAAMCIGMFMAILDVQVVATSLPTIQRALGIAQDQMSWVQTAYLIAEIIAIPLTGFLVRTLTMRRLFVIAVSFFVIASIACAASTTFSALIVGRVVQGFFGGTLIPAVFAAVFLHFPSRSQSVATVVAGVLAVLAPTLGPVVGGWITSTYSWPWLFLINVAPGIVVAWIAWFTLPNEGMLLGEFRDLDWPALGIGAIALATVEIAVKEAPDRGWASVPVAGLLAVSVIAAAVFVWRTIRSRTPIVNLRTFGNRNFSIGCCLSFVLGMGLFGSVYLMPLFLAYVRGHDALEIGQIMLVTGVAQLIAAPIATVLVRRLDERLLSAFGFVLFAVGLALSAGETNATDFTEMFWPQVMRGAGIMFCILPPTQLALGNLAGEAVADASGLFNMMRNLGGAIGIAVTDTIIYGRAPEHAQHLIDRLTGGDLSTAVLLGMTRETLSAALLDPSAQVTLSPLVEKAAFVQAVNDAWWYLGVIAFAGLFVLPWAKRTSEGGPAFEGLPPRR
jgi:DHA2 family multidrug resistance protein